MGCADVIFLAQGFRFIAHDRRGHGRSTQVGSGHDMDHYAADASAVAEHLNLRNAVHIGHSTGGGEVARYVAQYGQPQGRVAKAVLISAVPPLTLVIWGRGDFVFGVAGAEAYKKDLKTVDLHILDGAGHFALETNGPEIARYIRGFLAAHRED